MFLIAGYWLNNSSIIMCPIIHILCIKYPCYFPISLLFVFLKFSLILNKERERESKSSWLSSLLYLFSNLKLQKVIKKKNDWQNIIGKVFNFLCIMIFLFLCLSRLSINKKKRKTKKIGPKKKEKKIHEL